MNDDILNSFETQIEALINRYEQLKQENARLREKQANLFTQNSTIEKKHTMVIDGIQKMIERLKMVEGANGSE
ncbi:MAG: hypothetical protein PVI75_07185 [Gammaproteobacteria bacterium]|jgi:uncharacterized protein (TIGR02449 family)